MLQCFPNAGVFLTDCSLPRVVRMESGSRQPQLAFALSGNRVMRGAWRSTHRLGACVQIIGASLSHWCRWSSTPSSHRIYTPGIGAAARHVCPTLWKVRLKGKTNRKITQGKEATSWLDRA